MITQSRANTLALTPFAEFSCYRASVSMLLGREVFDHFVHVVLVTLSLKPQAERAAELGDIAAMMKAVVETEREDGLPEPYLTIATGAIMCSALSLLALIPLEGGRA
jgi:hypothetical protein